MFSGKAGFIHKEGAKILNWKKRYLVVEQDRLSYYVKEDKREKKGDILLSTIKGVRRMDRYKNRKYVFGLVTVSGRTYYIQGGDDDNVTGWIKAISEAVASNKAASGNSNTAPLGEADGSHNFNVGHEAVGRSCTSKPTSSSRPKSRRKQSC